jgi:hypothetical protein
MWLRWSTTTRRARRTPRTMSRVRRFKLHEGRDADRLQTASSMSTSTRCPIRSSRCSGTSRPRRPTYRYAYAVCLQSDLRRLYWTGDHAQHDASIVKGNQIPVCDFSQFLEEAEVRA